MLSYCLTCNILRPPRSFHCSSCDVCIEVQDHHCPWMGTCVGKRNIRYFILFLLLTSFHAIFGFVLTITNFGKLSDWKIENLSNHPNQIINFGVAAFTCCIGLMLLLFGSYTLHLQLSDVTSNENLRSKWNANREIIESYVSTWEKIRYVLWEANYVSRIQVYKQDQSNSAVLKDYGIFL